MHDRPKRQTTGMCVLSADVTAQPRTIDMPARTRKTNENVYMRQLAVLVFVSLSRSRNAKTNGDISPCSLPGFVAKRGDP